MFYAFAYAFTVYCAVLCCAMLVGCMMMVKWKFFYISSIVDESFNLNLTVGYGIRSVFIVVGLVVFVIYIIVL